MIWDRPFWQKAMKQPTVSLEVTDGEYGEKNGEVGGKYGNNC